MNKYFFLFLLIITIWLPLNLPVTASIFIPTVGLMLLGGFALSRRPRLDAVAITFLVSTAFVLFVCLFASDMQTALTRRVRSAIQLPYCLTMGALIATGRPFDKSVLERISSSILLFICGFVVFAYLESYTGVVKISDAFRDRVYDSRMIYSNDERDLMLKGSRRAKVFTSEPSQAANTIILLSFCALPMTSRRGKRLAFGVLMLLATPALYSPALPISAAIYGVCAFLADSRQMRWKTIMISLAAMLPVVALGAILFSGMLSQRETGAGYESSTFMRIIQPFHLTVAALKFNPLIGVGFGGSEEIWTSFEYIEGEMDGLDLGANLGATISTIPILSGLLGCLMFVALIWWLSRIIDPRFRISFLLGMIFLLFQKGNIVITPVWLVMAIWVFILKRPELVQVSLRGANVLRIQAKRLRSLTSRPIH